jgi:hypothetical protein
MAIDGKTQYDISKLYTCDNGKYVYRVVIPTTISSFPLI